ncbi:MAG: TetR/AcrR family transcriptional regulator [Eubacterium sp.]
MNKDIKQDILTAAKRLFNAHGYNQVSMRNIADSLGISVGNLTYHYKKKEELVEAVILTQHGAYKKFTRFKTLPDLDLFFRHVLDHQEKNTYYFRNYDQLAQLSAEVYALQKKVTGDLYDNLDYSFSCLAKNGLMQEDHIPHQKDLLVQSLMFLCTHGISMNTKNRLLCLWSLVYPLLTERGTFIYKTTIAPSLPDFET